jgi:hypothetical protein
MELHLYKCMCFIDQFEFPLVHLDPGRDMNVPGSRLPCSSFSSRSFVKEISCQHACYFIVVSKLSEKRTLFCRINPYNEAAKKGLERLEKQMKVYACHNRKLPPKIDELLSCSGFPLDWRRCKLRSADYSGSPLLCRE